MWGLAGLGSAIQDGLIRLKARILARDVSLAILTVSL